MCEHVGLECPQAGCWCECERCEGIRRDAEADRNAPQPLERGQEARHAAEFKSLERPEWSAEPWKA